MSCLVAMLPWQMAMAGHARGPGLVCGALASLRRASLGPWSVSMAFLDSGATSTSASAARGIAEGKTHYLLAPSPPLSDRSEGTWGREQGLSPRWLPPGAVGLDGSERLGGEDPGPLAAS